MSSAEFHKTCVVKTNTPLSSFISIGSVHLSTKLVILKSWVESLSCVFFCYSIVSSKFTHHNAIFCAKNKGKGRWLACGLAWLWGFPLAIWLVYVWRQIPSVGCPVGLPPLFFLRETRKLKSEKREEKETDGELTTSPYPSLSFSNSSFQSPAFSTVAMSRHKISPILATSRRDKYRGHYHDVARIIIRRRLEYFLDAVICQPISVRRP